MKYFLFHEVTIIVANKQSEAEKLYIDVYGEFDEIEEINDDYIVGANQNYNMGGFDEIHLYEVSENKPLPYILDVDLLNS